MRARHRLSKLLLRHQVRFEGIVSTNGSAEDRWLGVSEAAEYLSCSPSRLYEFTSRDRIPYERDGRRILFLRSQLDRWVRAGGAKRLGS